MDSERKILEEKTWRNASNPNGFLGGGATKKKKISNNRVILMWSYDFPALCWCASRVPTSIACLLRVLVSSRAYKPGTPLSRASAPVTAETPW